MDIEVVATGYLKEHVNPSLPLLADKWSGKELGALLAQLSIPPSLAYVALVNGQREPKTYVLQEGDVVKVVPLLTGG